MSYSIEDLDAAELGYLFCGEARKLWEEQRSIESVNNVAASQILCSVCLSLGLDEFGHELLTGGRKMAESLNLFGIEHSASLAATFDALSMKEKRAAACTAWGFYSWQTWAE
jgi:hypothetical protein